jgi:hypothetical protein
MQKLTRNEVDRLTGAARTISDVFDEIAAMRERYLTEFQNVLSELAEAQEEARGILDDAASAAEEYADERSEKWHESERGSAYNEWKENLRRLADEASEDIEPPEISELEAPEWVAECAACDFAEFEE